MDLSNPISSVIPSAHGAVLAILARTEHPLSGRRIAVLTGGRVSQSRASEVLRELVEAGVVLAEAHPPAILYTLNRAHLAADAIQQLARLRDALLDRMRIELATWSTSPDSAWLFGSAARGDGGVASDIDVLIVRPEDVSVDDASWAGQVRSFAERVAEWTGNRCAIAEFGAAEFASMIDRGERLISELRRDGIPLLEESSRPPLAQASA